MRGILEYFLRLQDFGHILLHPVAVVHRLVPVARDFEVAIVYLVANGGHVGHLHVC